MAPTSIIVGPHRRPQARPRVTDLLGRVEPSGSPGGPCAACRHTYCRLMRATAEARCTSCRKPIGYDRSYVATSGGGVRHDDCSGRQGAAALRRPIRHGVQGQAIRFTRRRQPAEDAPDLVGSVEQLEETEATVCDVVSRRGGVVGVEE